MEGTNVGWATWLSGGSQRYLVISEDANLLGNPTNGYIYERLEQEFELSFHSIGLSLVNDVIGKEILYASMTNSGIVWEHRKVKGKKYRPFTEGQNVMLERVYAMHQSQLKMASGNASVPPLNSFYVIGPNLEVDFGTMMSQKPFVRHIRRTFHPGVWTQVQRSASQRNLHLR